MHQIAFLASLDFQRLRPVLNRPSQWLPAYDPLPWYGDIKKNPVYAMINHALTSIQAIPAVSLGLLCIGSSSLNQRGNTQATWTTSLTLIIVCCRRSHKRGAKRQTETIPSADIARIDRQDDTAMQATTTYLLSQLHMRSAGTQWAVPPLCLPNTASNGVG